MNEVFYKKLLYLNLALTVEQKAWDESEHPRAPAGSSEGGQFVFVRINSHRAYDKVEEMLGKDAIKRYPSFHHESAYEISVSDYSKIQNVPGITIIKKGINKNEYLDARDFGK